MYYCFAPYSSSLKYRTTGTGFRSDAFINIGIYFSNIFMVCQGLFEKINLYVGGNMLTTHYSGHESISGSGKQVQDIRFRPGNRRA